MSLPGNDPSTIIVLFGYGSILPESHACTLRDAASAAFIAGRAAGYAELAGHLRRIGVSVEVPPHWEASFSIAPADALVERARAIVCKNFLASSHEVLIMCDRDITWQGPAQGYEGDLLHLARKARDTRGIVGAMVSKKVRGDGIASMMSSKGPSKMYVGVEQLVPAWFPGSGLTAYHRDAVYAVSQAVDEVPPGYRPIFGPYTVVHPEHPGWGLFACRCGAQWQDHWTTTEATCPDCGSATMPEIHEPEMLALSEDWAFCARARELGFESYLATKPKTGHIGTYTFTVDDAQPQREPTRHATISLIHATRGRREMAAAAKKLWLERASGKHQIEHLFSCDNDDIENWPDGDHVIAGDNRGNVDAYNRATYRSRGDILVQMHDDVEPPQDWDDTIASKLDPSCAQVLHVSDGLPPGVNNKPHLIPIMICTRKWAEKLGGLFYPEYVSIYCDDDASEKAYREGAVIEAQDVVFKHDWQGADRDDTQRRSYRRENWEHGATVLASRRADGFPDATNLWGAL